MTYIVGMPRFRLAPLKHPNDVLVLNYSASGKFGLMLWPLYFGATAISRMIKHPTYSLEDVVLTVSSVAMLLLCIPIAIEATKRVEYKSESIGVSWLFGTFTRNFSLHEKEKTFIDAKLHSSFFLPRRMKIKNGRSLFTINDKMLNSGTLWSLLREVD